MSLKIFHICFIIISTLLCAGCAWWAMENGARSFLAGAIIAALLLPVYGVWFLKKVRRHHL